LKTDTKYFGQIEYEKEDVLTFPRGLFGFEEEHEFLLLPFSGEGALFSLQSLRTPGLAFVTVDPFTVKGDYAPVLQPDELKEMGVEDSHELFFYTLCAVKDPVARSTLNLRCPIAINDNRQAMQVILEDERYGMRHLLSDVERQEEEASC